MTIGAQASTVFGGKCLVTVNSLPLGMADSFALQHGYTVQRNKQVGSQFPEYMFENFYGTLVVTGLYTTDNAFNTYATPSSGVLAEYTVTVAEIDTAGTPITKTLTCKGFFEPWERMGQADQFGTFRFTLQLDAEPTET